MKLPRGIVILAAVTGISIAVNLFLAGNIVSHSFRAPPPPLDIEWRLGGIWRDMSDADQPVARSILSQHHDTIVEKLNALKAANQNTAAAMRSDAFVADEAKRAFGETNQRLTEFRTAIQDTTIEIATKVSPEGRKRMRVPGGGF